MKKDPLSKSESESEKKEFLEEVKKDIEPEMIKDEKDEVRKEKQLRCTKPHLHNFPNLKPDTRCLWCGVRVRDSGLDPELPKEIEMKQAIVIEQKPIFDWNRAVIYISVIAVVAIVFFSQYMSQQNPALLMLTWLFGMMCFLPLGLFLGWIFLDPYMRCKVMRRFRGKNYGLVHFVHKGGKRFTIRVKNLDDDVVVQETRLWLINKNGIYYMDKNNNKVLHAEITGDNIITLPSNVPALFLDAETMVPLTFHYEPSKSNPQQAGATILGYINNQIAKNLFFKKTMTIFYVIIIALCAINLVIGVQLYQWMEEMYNLIPQLQSKISALGNLINELNPPGGI